MHILGAVLLTTGCLVGLVTPAEVLIGLAGGTCSILAAPALLLPPLRAIPRLLPRNGILRIAAANLVQEPLRTARTVLPVITSLALITMFTVAGIMWSATLNHELGDIAQARPFVDGMLTAVAVFTSVSVIVAPTGVASTLSLSVLQRRRELGMLRATGLTRRQTRAMLITEAVPTTTGTIVGLLLGTVCGFAGYTSTLGSVHPPPPAAAAALHPRRAAHRPHLRRDRSTRSGTPSRGRPSGRSSPHPLTPHNPLTPHASAVAIEVPSRRATTTQQCPDPDALSGTPSRT